MKSLVFALMALVIAPSLAVAGGGNSKEDPTIRVRNNSDAAAFVVIDDFNDAMAEADTLEEFEAAGGIFLNPGETSDEVEVKAGTHNVFYFFTDGINLPEDENDFTSKSARVRAGQDAIIRIP